MVVALVQDFRVLELFQSAGFAFWSFHSYCFVLGFCIELETYFRFLFWSFYFWFIMFLCFVSEFCLGLEFDLERFVE